MKRKMQNWTPKKHPIVVKIRPIPPSTRGESLTMWQLWHWLATGDVTLRLPPYGCINNKTNHRKWWGVIGSDFVLCFSEFNSIWRFEIRVRSFYHLQPPQDPEFELFTLYPQCFLSFCYFARFDRKCNMKNRQFEKSECSR